MKELTNEDDFFYPKWPKGLKMNQTYRLLCDDSCPSERLTKLDISIGEDGDIYLSACDMDLKDANPQTCFDPYPSLRCRTLAGGGRNTRTRQALLYLAQAIRLDEEELQGHT